jgi:hypothetical protein
MASTAGIVFNLLDFAVHNDVLYMTMQSHVLFTVSNCQLEAVAPTTWYNMYAHRSFTWFIRSAVY